jgi:hypothetical protein
MVFAVTRQNAARRLDTAELHPSFAIIRLREHAAREFQGIMFAVTRPNAALNMVIVEPLPHIVEILMLTIPLLLERAVMGT